KWARALAGQGALYAASTRGFATEFDAVVPGSQRLALNTRPAFEGGNIGVLRAVPRLGRWLRPGDAEWIHAPHPPSHGTLAWLARRGWLLRARLVSSAWGSDILVTPAQSTAVRWLTTRVLKASALCTSDSAHMAERMRELGAAEVMTFPFGLDALP